MILEYVNLLCKLELEQWILFTAGYFPELWFSVNHAKLSHVTHELRYVKLIM